MRLLVLPQKRKSTLRSLLKQHYPDAFSSDLSRLGLSRLEQLFARRGLSGATLKRASSFFVGAALYSGLNLSSDICHATRKRVRRPPRRNSTDNAQKSRKHPESSNETVTLNFKNFQFSFSFPADFSKLLRPARERLYRLLDDAMIFKQELHEQDTRLVNGSTDITELDLDNLSSIDEAIH